MTNPDFNPEHLADFLWWNILNFQPPGYCVKDPSCSCLVAAQCVCRAGYFEPCGERTILSVASCLLSNTSAYSVWEKPLVFFFCVPSSEGTSGLNRLVSFIIVFLSFFLPFFLSFFLFYFLFFPSVFFFLIFCFVLSFVLFFFLSLCLSVCFALI